MRLGIDMGTYSIKAVVLDDSGKVIEKIEKVHRNKVRETLKKLLDEIGVGRDEKVILACTGAMSHLANLSEDYLIGETKALSAGLKNMAGGCNGMIVLGAQKTYYLKQNDDKVPTVYKNTNCSAGTGSFFEEQAGRLQIQLEDISEIIKDAKSIPSIAGRCSVFSKTDMIHRMQEGSTIPDILLGLCYAMVRNYRSNILKNQTVATPVFLAGGVMKNAGVIQALEKELKLNKEDYVLNEMSDYMAAAGAALSGEKTLTVSELYKELDKEIALENNNQFPPLYKFVDETDKPGFNTVDYEPELKTYLGIDIGSTSINLVLVNENHQVIYFSYVKTIGKPLEIVKREIEKLHTSILNLKIDSIAVTGSGREYIGKEIGASLVINEITAQTEGALMAHDGTDTIFEIGGQDSKYMAVHEGKMMDFEMNKVCAAGTGAFLEEQIKKLGLSMEEFLELAMKSKHPCELGDRCTVFIESSINKALGNGHAMEDVCAGLAYAIVSNYLHRVVNQKKIGESIALQGGIAYNQAVICAFRALTGKEIHVTPYFSVTGALGAANLCMNQSNLTFDKEKNQKLNKILLEKSEASYLKDYESPDLDSKENRKKKVVGVPRVVFLHKMFPLFNTMFTKLGFDVLISPLTNREIIKRAQDNATAETCYPIKLIYGHVQWLVEQGVDYIVLPRLYTIKHEGSVARKDYACMYMQTSPILIEQALHLKEQGITLIMPELSIEFGKKYMINSLLNIGPQIGKSKALMAPAAVAGFASLVAHGERLEAIGRESLEGDEPIFVLISRVYNIIDPVLNMGIEEHLNKIGCRVVHLEHLAASYMNVSHDYSDLYWPFGQHILTGLKIIKANKNFYPIYITNHGCGPDTAIQHFFQNEMGDREYLHLEVDEHTSKVGVITRLEAFLYSLHPQEAIETDGIVYGNHKCAGCNTCADAGKQAELSHFDKVLIPDYGMYTDLIEKYLPENHPEVVKVKPLSIHKSFNYAMNKEYFSMLVMLEELLDSVEKGISYVMVAPIDEGSEVFGQYALLCQQEMVKQGYDVTLHSFYIEDIIKRPDNLEIYKDMLRLEVKNYRNSMSKSKKILAIGEPMSVYKPYIWDKNIENVSAEYGINRMPYSELLLFHMIEIDRKREYTNNLKAWKKAHDFAMEKCRESDVYSDMEALRKAPEGRLDFCVGNGAKYRFAKLLLMNPENTDYAVIFNSSEENVAVILKQIIERYRQDIKVPFLAFDLDHEHRAGKEEFELMN